MPSRFATRECSVEIFCALSWSFQKPGSLIARSSSARRCSSRSGSKVITDPAELGPDLLELLLQRAVVLPGHAPIVPAAAALVFRGLWTTLNSLVTASDTGQVE